MLSHRPLRSAMAVRTGQTAGEVPTSARPTLRLQTAGKGDRDCSELKEGVRTHEGVEGALFLADPAPYSADSGKYIAEEAPSDPGGGEAAEA